MSSSKTTVKNKNTGKVPKSPRSKKKKCVKNTFDMVQFKKMIGKGLVTMYKGAVYPQVNDIKDKILSGNIKSIAMTGFVSSGVIYVFNGIERLIAIHAISYADIKKHELEIEIIINQYSKLTPQDITDMF